MRNFRRALLTALSFLVLVSAISVPALYAYFADDTYYYQDAQIRTELAGTVDTFFLGASHGMRAFDPICFDETSGASSYNLCNPMMTMQGRYFLLQQELQRNPVKTVVMELSYNAMSRTDETDGTKEGDWYLMGRLENTRQRLQYLHAAFSVDEVPALYCDTMTRGLTCILMDLGLREPMPHASERTRRGYLPASGTDQSQTQETLVANYHKFTLSRTIAPENAAYLQAIADLCGQHGVELILVVTPVTTKAATEYYGVQYISNYYADFAAENGLRFYDCNLLREKTERFPDAAAYMDDTHLSQAGAEQFSRLLAELLWPAPGEQPDEWFYPSYYDADAARGLVTYEAFIREVTSR